MIETLDMRLNQAQKDGVNFTQFLEVLLEDEVQHRTNKRLSTRIIRAHFEEEKSLEGFDFNFNPSYPPSISVNWPPASFMERKESVILCGPVGVGKTHLAQALGHQACRSGYNVLFMKASRLLADLGGGRADETWEKRIQHYLKPNLLIVDDFANAGSLPRLRPRTSMSLSTGAITPAPLIVTANRAPKTGSPLFPNPVIAESALDRLISGGSHDYSYR